MSKDKQKPTPDQPGANTMWGGRFAAGPAAVMEEINASIDFDRRMAAEDIALGNQVNLAQGC